MQLILSFSGADVVNDTFFFPHILIFLSFLSKSILLSLVGPFLNGLTSGYLKQCENKLSPLTNIPCQVKKKEKKKKKNEWKLMFEYVRLKHLWVCFWCKQDWSKDKQVA